MTMITLLPDEVIIIILEKRSILLEDIVNFQSTCKRFQQITLSNKFWEKKYYQRCPTANKEYNVDKKKKIFDYLDFKEQTITGIKCLKMLQKYMILENKHLYMKKEELRSLLHTIVEDSLLYYFVYDEHDRIIPAEFSWLENMAYIFKCHLIFLCVRYQIDYETDKSNVKPKYFFDHLIALLLNTSYN